MMKLAIAALAASASALSFAGSLVDKTDRFRDTRLVGWESFTDAGRGYSYNVYAHYSKASDAHPYGYYALLVAPFGSKPFGSCHHNHWLVDGKQAPELEMAYDSSSGAEVFRVELKRGDLEQLAAAKAVEFQICTDEARVSASDLDGLRKVLKATE